MFSSLVAHMKAPFARAVAVKAFFAKLRAKV